ncbi:hypothetical protein WDW37_19095 [Bdellovibrionota bacterium FG-1]
MKTIELFFAFAFAFLLSLGPTHPIQADPRERVEVPIQRVFFLNQGLDDHEPIHIVIEGFLPDPCYVVETPPIELNPSTSILLLHAFAWRQETPLCQTGDLLEPQPFSLQVNLGRLQAGDYQVAFISAEGIQSLRPLHITPAQVNASALPPDAQIMTLQIKDLWLSTETIQIVLNGAKTRCSKFLHPAQIEKSNDVIAITLPMTHCSGPFKKFKKTIALRPLPGGRYLIQVRIPNSRSVEKPITVMSPPI